MKKLDRKDVRLDDALKMLIGWQAHCISVGHGHGSFAEALKSKQTMSDINDYINVMDEQQYESVECYGYKHIGRMMRLLPYTTSNEHMANAFVILNAYLIKLYDKVCIFSNYDMEVIIDALGRRKGCVEKIPGGVMNYSLADDEHNNVICNIIAGSIHSMKSVIEWTDQDCILHPITLWLLHEDYMINDHNMTAKFLPSDDGRGSYARGDVVFTKLIDYCSDRKFNRFARKYSYDCLDRVATLLYCLPICGATVTHADVDITKRNIESFFISRKCNTGYQSNYVRISQSADTRAIMYKSLYMLSKHIPDKGTYVVTIAHGYNTYVLDLEEGKLMSSIGTTQVTDPVIWAIGKTFDFTIKNDKDGTVESLIRRCSEKKFDAASDEIIKKFIQEAV